MSLAALLAALKGSIETQLHNDLIVPPDESDIRAAVDKKLPIFAPEFGISLDEQLREEVIKSMLMYIPIKMRIGAALRDQGLPPPWADSRNLDWKCWNAYETYLYGEMYSRNVIMTLRDDTRKILDLLGNPALSTDWDRRGLVLGHVQSGKTSNYTG